MTDPGGGDRCFRCTVKTVSPRSPGTHPYRPPVSAGPMASPGLSRPPAASPGVAPGVRCPSPNYFGLVVDPAEDARESTVVPGHNWSPPTSSIRSFATAIPKHLPLDANPEFEAFRRQADLNRAGS